jgi:hypothetical protein
MSVFLSHFIKKYNVSVQNGSEFPTTAYPLVPKTLITVVKRLGREADHPLPPSAEIRNAWPYTLPQRVRGTTLPKSNKRAKGKLHSTQKKNVVSHCTTKYFIAKRHWMGKRISSNCSPLRRLSDIRRSMVASTYSSLSLYHLWGHNDNFQKKERGFSLKNVIYM